MLSCRAALSGMAIHRYNCHLSSLSFTLRTKPSAISVCDRGLPVLDQDIIPGADLAYLETTGAVNKFEKKLYQEVYPITSRFWSLV